MASTHLRARPELQSWTWKEKETNHPVTTLRLLPGQWRRPHCESDSVESHPLETPEPTLNGKHTPSRLQVAPQRKVASIIPARPKMRNSTPNPILEEWQSGMCDHM